jgi:transcriptional regulator of acetoin/glycerol metabolism
MAVEPQAMAQMLAHDWPGNIRELRNVLDRARLFADDGIVRAEHLPESLRPGSLSPPLRRPPLALPAATPATTPSRQGEIGDAELRQLAATSQGTRKELARQAGLSERTLYRRLKGLGLV